MKAGIGLRLKRPTRWIHFVMLFLVPLYAIGSDVLCDTICFNLHIVSLQQTIPEVVEFDDTASTVTIERRSTRASKRNRRSLFSERLSSAKREMLNAHLHSKRTEAQREPSRAIPDDERHLFHCTFLI